MFSQSECKYEINAFFQDDLRPLNDQEIDQALQVLSWQQDELLAGIEFADQETLNRVQFGQRWSILGIVRHLAFAELWYLQNFTLPASDFPPEENPLSLIAHSFTAVTNALPTLVGCSSTTEYTQERWSGRKLVRRVLWHRRDHIDHIRHLVGIV